MRRLAAAASAVLAAAGAAAADSNLAPPRFAGTELTIGGHAEVEVVNDEATASLYAEQQDADQARAQSLVNQRVADGIAALKRADPKAHLESAWYGTYPVYGGANGNGRVIAWRVRQAVTLRTSNLADLPRTIAAGQAVLALENLQFGLSRAARARTDTELVQRAIADANARIAAAAQALGVPAERIRLEALDFGGRPVGRPIMPMMRAAAAPAAREAVAEPAFEAGSSTQQLDVSARARLLPAP